MNTDEHLDRTTHPELTGLFDALDELAAPPTDPTLRATQIERAALLARSATSGPIVATGVWNWRRAASWRVAAAAAACVALVAGLGADDRLPEPAQRVVSSVAEAVGIEVPDGSERDAGADAVDGTAGDSGTTPAVPARPGEPGEPATPATPAVPGDRQGGDQGTAPGEPPRAEPAIPAQPGDQGEPAEPATPAVPSPPTTERPERPDPAQQDREEPEDKAKKDKAAAADDDDDEQ